MLVRKHYDDNAALQYRLDPHESDREQVCTKQSATESERIVPQSTSVQSQE